MLFGGCIYVHARRRRLFSVVPSAQKDREREKRQEGKRRTTSRAWLSARDTHYIKRKCFALLSPLHFACRSLYFPLTFWEGLSQAWKPKASAGCLLHDPCQSVLHQKITGIVWLCKHNAHLTLSMQMLFAVRGYIGFNKQSHVVINLQRTNIILTV